MIITNARILTFDSANRVLDSGSVEIRRRRHHRRCEIVRGARGKNVIDAKGKLLMPALINCHTHLYSTLARGISLAGPRAEEFPRDPEEALVAARPRA